MRKFIFISLCLLWGCAATCSYATVSWKVFDPCYIPQNDPMYSEVLPAEDMDGHTITWGPNSHVRFWPSLNYGTPKTGDIHCWLYGGSGVTWWEGQFNNPSTEVRIQLPSCNSNDGMVNIYVNGIFEHSYNSQHATPADVLIIGTGLSYTNHLVRIETSANYGGDIHLDYVAIPEPATITLLGLGGLLLRRHKH